MANRRANEIIMRKLGISSQNNIVRQNELIIENRLELNTLQSILSCEPNNKSIKDTITRIEEQMKPYPEIQENTKEVKEKTKQKKKSISATTKRLVWNMNIGEEIGKSKCMCCKTTDITQMSFHCGHVISESDGGETIVSNLKPICQNCNSSMGKKNMNDFMHSLN
jgi:5-methylcytosine-specific restriction endonuclease McrA